MSKNRYWRAVSVDCIRPEIFPNMAIYLKSSENYILYKDHERRLTEADLRRLERSFTEFIYVRSGDTQAVDEYLERCLDDALTREDLSSEAKGNILYQASVNSVVDLFESPEESANLNRSRTLIRHMLQYVATDPNALKSLRTVANNNLYLFAHSVQVAALSLLFHEKRFNLAPDEMIDVGIGSLLHDFGMTFICSEVMDKPDALSKFEYHTVKQHTRKGYDFLKGTGHFSQIALQVVRHHHERYDGNGYPDGLKGDAIPRSAQVAAICNVYSALSLERPYRKASSQAEALKAMAEDAKNGAFNQELFDCFYEIITEVSGTV